MSEWLNKLRPASFRGVPFFLLEDPDVSVGRRHANHEYAGRDTPYSEDLGRKQRSYTISGGLDGDDFIEKANRLIDACEQRGPGILVHPFLGELLVTVEARFTFQGRFASFQMTATEAGENANPSRSTDTRNIVNNKAIAARSASISAFVKKYDASGPAFIREQISQTISDTLSQIQSVAVVPNVAAPSIIDISKAIDSARELANALFDNLALVFNSSNQSISDPAAIFVADKSNASELTSARQKPATNKRAILRLMYEATVIDAAKKITDFNFATQADAVKRVGDIANNIEQASFDADDNIYRALTDLRIAVQQDMQERLPSLPTLKKFNVVQATPSLVIAYRYGDGINSEPVFVVRNNISHPGFIRGDIEVINESTNV